MIYDMTSVGTKAFNMVTMCDTCGMRHLPPPAGVACKSTTSFDAKFDGTCVHCLQRIHLGTKIARGPGAAFMHAECAAMAHHPIDRNLNRTRSR